MMNHSITNGVLIDAPRLRRAGRSTAFLLIWGLVAYFVSKEPMALMFSGICFVFLVSPSGWGCDLHENGVQRVSFWKPMQFATWEEIVQIEIDRKPHYSETSGSYPYFVRLTSRCGDTYYFSYRNRMNLFYYWSPILEAHPNLSAVATNQLHQLEWF